MLHSMFFPNPMASSRRRKNCKTHTFIYPIHSPRIQRFLLLPYEIGLDSGIVYPSHCWIFPHSIMILLTRCYLMFCVYVFYIYSRVTKETSSAMTIIHHSRCSISRCSLVPSPTRCTGRRPESRRQRHFEMLGWHCWM